MASIPSSAVALPPTSAGAARTACAHEAPASVTGGGDALLGALETLRSAIDRLAQLVGGGGSDGASGGVAALGTLPPATSDAGAGVSAGATTRPAAASAGGPIAHMDHGDMDMASVPGSAAQSPDARAAYAAAQAFVTKYPTEQSLKDAGFGVEPNGNHYRVWDQDIDVFSGHGADAAQAIVEDGRVIGLQLDTNVKGAEPPAWSGVDWHSHGDQGWMTHVYVDRPIETAFVDDGRM